jgi:hypothetical protein
MSVLSELAKFGEEVKNGIELAGKDAEKAAAWLVKNGALIQSLTDIVSPTAGAIEGNMFALYQKLAQTCSTASDAAVQNGLSVPLDGSVVAMLKADYAALKNFKF